MCFALLKDLFLHKFYYCFTTINYLEDAGTETSSFWASLCRWQDFSGIGSHDRQAGKHASCRLARDCECANEGKKERKQITKDSSLQSIKCVQNTEWRTCGWIRWQMTTMSLWCRDWPATTHHHWNMTDRSYCEIKPSYSSLFSTTSLQLRANDSIQKVITQRRPDVVQPQAGKPSLVHFLHYNAGCDLAT